MSYGFKFWFKIFKNVTNRFLKINVINDIFVIVVNFLFIEITPRCSPLFEEAK